MSPPLPQSPSWLRRCPRQFPHMELGITLAGKPRQQAALPAPLTKSGTRDVAGGVSPGTHSSGGCSSERGAPLPHHWFPPGVLLSHPGGSLLSALLSTTPDTCQLSVQASLVPLPRVSCCREFYITMVKWTTSTKVAVNWLSWVQNVSILTLCVATAGVCTKVVGLGLEAGTSRGIRVTCERGRETHMHTT